MERNKITTYLLYAIGEIILVVIGILIAVSINNWNNNSIQRQDEKKYLTNLLIDLQNQQAEIGRQMNMEGSFMAAKERLDPLLLQGFVSAPDMVQLNQDLMQILNGRTISSFDATFEELKSSGKLNIISSDGLKTKILNFYQHHERIIDVLNHNSRDNQRVLWSKLIDQQIFQANAIDLVDEQFKSKIAKDQNQASTRFNDLQLAQLRIKENQLLLSNLLEIRLVLSLISTNLLEEHERYIEEINDAINTHLNSI